MLCLGFRLFCGVCMFTFLLKFATAFLLALVAVPSLAVESEHLGTDELVRDGLGALSSGNKEL